MSVFCYVFGFLPVLRVWSHLGDSLSDTLDRVKPWIADGYHLGKSHSVKSFCKGGKNHKGTKDVRSICDTGGFISWSSWLQAVFLISEGVYFLFVNQLHLFLL